MKYENTLPAVFLDRPNRFIANILIDGEAQRCHVKNTGRCRELLVPGAEIYVQKFDSPSRKTAFDLIAVRKGSRLINMDSQAPNQVVHEFLASGGLFPNAQSIRREVRHENSRFDFYVEAGTRRIFLEVKGVTLEDGGIVMFPDAPTERGLKHIRELQKCAAEGFEAYVFFVIQMSDVQYFTPNRVTHTEFADALAEARSEGVRILAYDCEVSPDTLSVRREVPILL